MATSPVSSRGGKVGLGPSRESHSSLLLLPPISQSDQARRPLCEVLSDVTVVITPPCHSGPSYTPGGDSVRANLCVEVSAVGDRFDDGEDLVGVPADGGGSEMTGLYRNLRDLGQCLKTV